MKLKRMIATLFISLMMAFSVTSVAFAADMNVSEVSAEICTLINNERAEHGLNTLCWSDRLAQDASVRTDEVMINWSHTRPNGTDWYTLDPEYMYGEILANQYTKATNVVQAWLNSSAHKNVMLGNTYTQMGLAAKQNSDGCWYYTVEFY